MGHYHQAGPCSMPIWITALTVELGEVASLYGRQFRHKQAGRLFVCFPCHPGLEMSMFLQTLACSCRIQPCFHCMFPDAVLCLGPDFAQGSKPGTDSHWE